MLAPLLIATAGLVGQTGRRSIQIVTEGLLQSAAIDTPQVPVLDSPFIGASQAWAFDNDRKNPNEDEEEFLVFVALLTRL